MQHRENTPFLDENTPTILRELPKDGVAKILRDLHVSCEEGGWFVPAERVASVRTQIAAVHNYTDKKIKTKDVEGGGINIWREL